MSEIREIVTRAVIAKGKKLIKIKEIIPTNEVCNVLGCWVINHEFETCLNGNKVEIRGAFEEDIWIAIDNNSRTDVVRKPVNYNDSIRVRELVCEPVTGHCDVIARVVNQPTCTSASITEEGIIIEVIFEMVVEVIGETKILVTVFASNDNYDTIDDFENEINEDFITEQ